MEMRDRERQEVERLFAVAEELRDYPGDYFPAQIRAENALKTWREKYPEAAKAEKKARLIRKAAQIREQADNALLYDADGWLDAAAKKVRHDEMVIEAEKIEAEIANL